MYHFLHLTDFPKGRNHLLQISPHGMHWTNICFIFKSYKKKSKDIKPHSIRQTKKAQSELKESKLMKSSTEMQFYYSESVILN